MLSLCLLWRQVGCRSLQPTFNCCPRIAPEVIYIRTNLPFLRRCLVALVALLHPQHHHHSRVGKRPRDWQANCCCCCCCCSPGHDLCARHVSSLNQRYYLAGQVLYEVCARQTQITSQPGAARPLLLLLPALCYWLGVSFPSSQGGEKGSTPTD